MREINKKIIGVFVVFIVILYFLKVIPHYLILNFIFMSAYIICIRQSNKYFKEKKMNKAFLSLVLSISILLFIILKQ